MNRASEISGWDLSSRRFMQLGWEDGFVTRFEETAPPKGESPWIAPFLFDLQINGYGGVDFQQDNLLAKDLAAAAGELRAAGCGKFLLALITAPWPTLLGRLRHLKQLRDSLPTTRAAIVGWHIEGPFLSELPGFHGAHDPSLMLDPTTKHLRELREIAGADPLLLTIAPERAGALEAIRAAVSLGITVSLGHTDASADIIERAVAAGATGFTHLANGCPRELDRGDNILWRVLERPELMVSVIPDKIHVSPSLFRLMHRLVDGRQIVYTTDAMSAAGAPPGRYSLGDTVVEVGDNKVVRQAGKDNFAGSALRPVEGVFRAAEMLGCDWQEAWIKASLHPAKLLGLRNDLQVGAPAGFCLVNVRRRNELASLRVIPELEPR